MDPGLRYSVPSSAPGVHRPKPREGAGGPGMWLQNAKLAKCQALEPRVQLGCFPLGTALLEGSRGLMTPVHWQLASCSFQSCPVQ